MRTRRAATAGRQLKKEMKNAVWMIAHQHNMEMCLVSQKLEHDTTVRGAAFQNGVQVKQELRLNQGREVLAVVDHTAANRTVIRLDMLMMCAQLPHGTAGIPIGYWMDDEGRAHELFSFTTASYNNWPQVLIDIIYFSGVRKKCT